MNYLKTIFSLLVAFIPSVAICQNPWNSIGVLCFKDNSRYNSIEVFDTKYLTEGRKYFDIHTRQLPYRIEYKDETYGISISEIHGDTIKMIIPNEMGSPKSVWILLDTTIMDYILWAEYIPQQKYVFFIDSKESAIRFFSSPNGERKYIALPDVKERIYMYGNTIWLAKDFDMVPTGYTANDGWLQVDVSIPHDEDEDEFECKRIRAWIKYIDENGRPLVWFNTRD
jgi:hypothetical protein